MKKCILLLLFSAIISALHADLVWDESYGWKPTADIFFEFNNAPSEVLQLMNDARWAQDADRIGEALANYTRVCKRYPDTIFAPEAYYQIGKIRVSRRQFNDAFDAFNAITKKYPKYPRFNNVLREEFEIARLLKSGERPKYFGVIPGFRDYRATFNFYKKIVEGAPFSDIAPLALSHMGELAISKDEPKDAIAALEQLIDSYPHSEYAPWAYFTLGEIYSKMVKSPLYDQGATKLAMSYYEDFFTLYPDDERVAEAREAYNEMKVRLAMSKILLGDFYFNAKNNPRAAVIMYRKAAKELPDSYAADEARMKIEHIKYGQLPRRTPVDFLFGRYERPRDERVADIDNIPDGSSDDDKFDLGLDFVRIKSSDPSDRKKFSNPDDPGRDDVFLEVGPHGSF
ncbi:MAG: tetratricopeptide repeat protein [Puniceicoccales bacterium]|nr:tetratricopeptide repeat protein [Puniceicoccales bacterium]